MLTVQLTFESFGPLAGVRRASLPNLANNAVAFEVGFVQRRDALAACRKYDGVLADGRVLQVTLQAAQPAAQPAPAPRAAAPTAGKGDLPLSVQRELAEAEARYLAEREAIVGGAQGKAGKAAGKAAGKKKAVATPAVPLKQRLGSLPLAKRLQASPALAQSDVALAGKSSSAQKRRRALRKKRAAGMDVE